MFFSFSSPTWSPSLLQALTKDLPEEEALGHPEAAVAGFRQRVRGHWVVVQLEHRHNHLESRGPAETSCGTGPQNPTGTNSVGATNLQLDPPVVPADVD